MELDFDMNVVLVTLGMWALILFLIWGIPTGFQGLREKIALSILSLPITYFIVVWQHNR